MSKSFGSVREFLKRSPGLVTAVRRTRRRYRRAIGRMRRGAQIRRYIDSHEMRKLQIGAGRNLLHGWLNTDFNPRHEGVVYVDGSEPLPFADGTFHYLLTEHLIEHLPYAAGVALLRECRRVLIPGGRLRVATPDLSALLSLFSATKGPMQQRYIEWISRNFIPEAPCNRESFVINNAFRNYGHKFLYDEATLRLAMESAGFKMITRYQPGESDSIELRGVESHGRDIGDEEINRYETMVLEGE